MKQNEKILAIGLAVIVVVYFGRGAVGSWLFKPFEDRQKQITSKQNELEALELKERQLLKSIGQLAEWREEGLVFDALVAQRLYQSWLTDLADYSGWKNVTVTPGNNKIIADKTATAVKVIVEGEADVTGLARFASMYDGAELFHRIERIDMKAASKQPGTMMKITLTAEAMAVEGAKRRPLPYAQWRIQDRLAQDQLFCRVEPPTIRPDDLPFEFRIAGDHFRLQEVADEGSLWIFESLGERRQSRTLQRGTRIQLVDGSADPDQLGQTWLTMVKSSPFTLPLPVVRLNPQIEVASTINVIRGTALDTTLKTTGFSPEAGSITYEVEGALPDGMQLNSNSGTLRWSPAADADERDISLEFRALASLTGEKASKKVVILLRKPNTPPTLDALPTSVAYSGQAWSIKLSAQDAQTPIEQLKYSLTGNIPSGMTVDSASGELRWSPTAEQENQTYQVTVQVSDAGVPVLSDQQPLSISVTHNKETTLTLFSSFEVNGEKKAWFLDSRTQKRLLLGEGDDVDASGFQGRIQTISATSVRLESGEKKYELELGKTISERKPL